MDLMLAQITGALDRGFHYLAVIGALTLPDQCAALESADGRSNQVRYEAWFNAWVAPKYHGWLSSFDVYRLRCGVVHQGTLGPDGMQYTRIAFGINRPNIHCNRGTVGGQTTLQLDAGMFCHEVMQSVREWYAAKHDDQNVQANMPRLLQFRPQGISAFNFPVIA
jgi:hypothetical protein